MGKNAVRVALLDNTPWTVPAGVTKVRATLVGVAGPQLATADNFLALNTSGQVYASGFNSSGQLGIGSVVNQSSPVLALGSINFRSLATGMTTNIQDPHALGIDINGNAYGWGYNGFGQLGVGDTTPRSSPVLCVGGFKFLRVSAGGLCSLAVDINRNIYAWGANGTGVLGLNDNLNRSAPTLLALGTIKFQDAVTNGQSSFGLTTTGDIYSWGYNFAGALGQNNPSAISTSSPVLISGGRKWKAIATGYSNSAAINTGGDLYVWGTNESGQLGNGAAGPTLSASSPVLVSGGIKWRRVAVGYQHMIGISTSGDLYAWGLNTSGNLGLGDTNARSSPVLIPGGRKWTEVSAGFNLLASHGLTITGDCYGWGANNGLLGTNDTTPKSTPILVVGGQRFNMFTESFISATMLDVTPGATYTPELQTVFPALNAVSLGLPGYNFFKLYLEYQA